MKRTKRNITPSQSEKQCNICKEYWPVDQEFFYKAGKKADGTTKYSSCCIACYEAYPSVQARRAAAPETNNGVIAQALRKLAIPALLAASFIEMGN